MSTSLIATMIDRISPNYDVLNHLLPFHNLGVATDNRQNRRVKPAQSHFGFCHGHDRLGPRFGETPALPFVDDNFDTVTVVFLPENPAY